MIVGARLGERDHRDDNRRLFSFELDEQDLGEIDEALTLQTLLPGDCGDEYRKPPFLTASGDLTHHLSQLPKAYAVTPVGPRPGRSRVDTGSATEAACGYSRAVRAGDRILVSGTTATHGEGGVVCPGDVEGQAIHILDKIEAAITALGGSIKDVDPHPHLHEGRGPLGRSRPRPWPRIPRHPAGQYADRGEGSRR